MVTISDLFHLSKQKGKKKSAVQKKTPHNLGHLSLEVHKKLVKERRERLQSFKAKMDRSRNPTDRAADWLTECFGSIWFFTFNTVWFAVWMVFNTGLFPGITTFDPYPFGLLTMVVSLEAIFLAIIVLISQNRAAHIADLREEIDLQVNVRAEHEITRMLIILDTIHDHLGLPAEDDAELILMKQKTNLNEIERDILADMKRK
jgi:uncharacterized membrane protein